jgi:hypothetical protein
VVPLVAEAAVNVVPVPEQIVLVPLTALTVGVGLTVMVKVFAVPVHPTEFVVKPENRVHFSTLPNCCIILLL